MTVYSYDVLAQLVGAKTTNTAGTVVNDFSYTYDGAGDRLSSSVNGSTTSYTYNDANEMTAAGGATYSYDGNGNQTGNSAGQSFGYNAKDQTVSVTPPGGAALPMTYADAGQSERVQAGSTKFTESILGLGIAQTPTGATYYTRDNNGNLINQRTPSGTYYYLFDGLGSVVGLTDSTGKLAASYKYDPYGRLLSSTGTVTNPWRYASGYEDTSTKLTKFGIRYYDPSLGRFTQPDPTGQDPHYTYARNNPSNFTDPTGAAVECEDIALVGGILGGAAIGVGVTAATFGVGTLAFAVGASAVGGVGGGTLVVGIGAAICGL